MIKVVCDRCGAEIKTMHESVFINNRDYISTCVIYRNSIDPKKVTLCETCFDWLERSLFLGEETNDR